VADRATGDSLAGDGSATSPPRRSSSARLSSSVGSCCGRGAVRDDELGGGAPGRATTGSAGAALAEPAPPLADADADVALALVLR